MKKSNLDAIRTAFGDHGFDGAADLVQRTLAQHGLSMPEGGGPMRMPFDAAQKPDPLPPGAQLVSDSFACAAGRRDYLAYVPASAHQGLQGMIVMLHGCTQDPADFARGTGMNALAEQHRLLILYPRQARGDNAQSCWNWFSPGDQRRGRGEPEILAQMAQDLARKHRVPQGRIFVAGLSAGAAMAVILGQSHPDVFAAVGAHSGLPLGAAKDVASAFAAMNAGPAAVVREGRGATPAATPTIIFHGTADHTVNPANAGAIAQAVLAAGPDQTLLDQQSRTVGGRSVQLEITSLMDGCVLLENWRVEGLGHAWSGGQPTGSYTDPQGPDASAEIVRFFLQQVG